MSWNDLSFGRKLTIGFGSLLALLLATAYLSYLGQRDNLGDALQASRYKDLTAELKDKLANHLEWSLRLSQGLVTQDIDGVAARSDPRECQFGRWYYGAGRQTLAGLVPDAVPILTALEEPHLRFHKAFQRIMEIHREGAPGHEQIAREAFTSEVLPSLERFQGLLRELEVEIERMSTGMSDIMTSHSRRNLALVTTAGGLAVLLGLLLAMATARSVNGPLRRIVAAADRIAAGDLDQDLQPTQRKDEIGSLQNAFARMNGSLLGVARSMERIAKGDLTLEVTPQSERDIMGKALATMTANLRELARTTRDTVAVLASTVNQISSSTAQLSASSAETATAVGETTTTVAEVKQTAHLSNEKARLVVDSAARASETARMGTRASEEAMDGMRLITEKMDFIAQNIVRLSEKSQDIGEIIGAVRELADKSNILAVNASIEASRAGEEGKGFAVVAMEIRNLAEQSKDAIRQIRDSLEDIQKATTASVMATEEGGKAVAMGRDKAAASREALLALAANVRESSQVATQIAASSKEELVGMDQVGTAMESIHQASSQNLESANQLEDSVHDLSDLAKDLMKLAERYKV